MNKAKLDRAILEQANLERAFLEEANYTRDTVWPIDFDPQQVGALENAAPLEMQERNHPSRPDRRAQL